MYSIGNIIRTVLLALCFLSMQGCGGSDVIERKVMTNVLVDIFLADQAIETSPSLNIQKDTMLVYPAIFEKYGITYEKFVASVTYYLEDDETYLDILKDAKKILQDKENKLSQKLKEKNDEEKSKELERWWAIDSIRSYTPDKLLQDKYLRSVRWIVMRDEKLQEWKFMDSAIVDIPQNPQWWKNTLIPQKRLYKDVFMEHLKKVNEPIKKIEKNEKAVSKLHRHARFAKTLNKTRVSATGRR